MYVQLCVEHYYVITWISKEVVHSDIRDDSSVDISVFFTRHPNRISGGPMGNYTSCFFFTSVWIINLRLRHVHDPTKGL